MDRIKSIADGIGMDISDLSKEQIEELNTIPLQQQDNLMSDEDISKISKLMDESMDEDSKLYRDIVDHKVEIPEVKDKNITISSTMQFDENGVPGAFEVHERKGPSIDDILYKNRNRISKQIQDLQNEGFLNTKTFLGTESLMELSNLILKLEAEGDYSNIYNRLPDNIKEFVKSYIPKGQVINQDTLEIASRKLIDAIMEELDIDSTIEEIDLRDVINNESKSMQGDLIAETVEKNTHNFETVMSEKANELEEEYPEKAKTLRMSIQYYGYAYNYELLYQLLEKKPRLARTLMIDTNKFSKFANRFNSKYASSKFTITNVFSLRNVLIRNLPLEDVTEKEILRFILLFIKSTENMEVSSNKIYEHTYMYFFIFNINAIDYIREEKITGILKTVFDNITDIILKMRELDKTISK